MGQTEHTICRVSPAEQPGIQVSGKPPSDWSPVPRAQGKGRLIAGSGGDLLGATSGHRAARKAEKEREEYPDFPTTTTTCQCLPLAERGGQPANVAQSASL